MAEKSSELKENSGEMSDTDKSIISTVASNSGGEFIEKYGSKPDENDEATEETSNDPDEIRSNIEDTRREMGETIDAIQERLSFANISEQVSEKVEEAIESAKESAYNATIGKAENFMKNASKTISKSSFFQSISENPVPYALIGLGAGVLLMNSYGTKNKSSHSTNNRREQESQRHSESMLKSAGAKVGDAASQTYDTLSDAAGATYETVTDAAQQTYEKVGDVGNQVKKQYDYYLEENPLAVGALAMAVGAAIGFAIPATDYESELVGDTRDRLMKRAGESVNDFVETTSSTFKETVQKVRSVADEAVNTAKDEAKNQGLVS